MFYNLPSGTSNLVYAISAIVFLSILFFFLFTLNVYVLERVSKLIYKRRIENEEEVQKQAVRLLEEAREQAFSIVRDANIKAQGILSTSGSLSSDANDALKGQLEKLHNKNLELLQGLSHDTLAVYQKMVEEEKNEGLKAIDETIDSVEDVASGAIDALRTEIDTQRKSYDEFFSESMKKEISEFKSDLNSYKDKKIEEISNQANLIIKDVCKEVIGKALPIEDQERLVMESLEKARTMGVFDND